MSVTVAIVGASGLVGEQLLAGLAGADLPIGRVTAWGGPNRAPSVDSVAYGAESIGVLPASRLDELEADVVFLCVPPAVTPRVAGFLRGRAELCVDVGGSVGALAHPGLQVGLPPVEEGRLRLPSATALVLAPGVASLVSQGLRGADVSAALSASSAGRIGVEELGQQSVARLNAQDPPRRVFPTGLAFDVLPEDAPEGEASRREAQAAHELAELSGLAPGDFGVQIGTFPLFAGLVVGVTLRGVSVDQVEQAWAGVPGYQAVSRVERLRPRSAVGKNVVGFGRLQGTTDGCKAWLVADPVAVAAGAAVELLRRSLGQA